MKKFLEFVGILGLVFGLGLKAEVSNIYVPSQYQTIQKAINDSVYLVSFIKPKKYNDKFIF